MAPTDLSELVVAGSAGLAAWLTGSDGLESAGVSAFTWLSNFTDRFIPPKAMFSILSLKSAGLTYAANRALGATVGHYIMAGGTYAYTLNGIVESRKSFGPVAAFLAYMLTHTLDLGFGTARRAAEVGTRDLQGPKEEERGQPGDTLAHHHTGGHAMLKAKE